MSADDSDGTPQRPDANRECETCRELLGPDERTRHREELHCLAVFSARVEAMAHTLSLAADFAWVTHLIAQELERGGRGARGGTPGPLYHLSNNAHTATSQAASKTLLAAKAARRPGRAGPVVSAQDAQAWRALAAAQAELLSTIEANIARAEANLEAARALDPDSAAEPAAWNLADSLKAARYFASHAYRAAQAELQGSCDE